MVPICRGKPPSHDTASGASGLRANSKAAMADVAKQATLVSVDSNT